MKQSAIRLGLGLAFCLSVSACNSTEEVDTQDLVPDTALVGKRVNHTWTEHPFPAGVPDPQFVTVFCDDKTLVWNSVADPSQINSSAESYHRVDIAPGVVQISWKEDPNRTNFGLVWTMDFTTNKIYGVIVNIDPNANAYLSGDFEVVDGVDVDTAAGLQGCPGVAP